MENEIQVLNAEVVKDTQFESQIDIAKRYPRDLTRVINNSIAIVTMDRETAETCNYSLPRGGKTLSGASVHLARIIVQQYGNLRVESRVTHSDAKQVHAEAVCFDLESNVAVKSTTSKSIIGKKGRFNEDMIVVTGKAAAAIAYRNAVFSVIPKAIVDKVYKSAMNKITGNITNEEQLIKRRTEALKAFKDQYAVEEKELLDYLGLNTINQIDQQQIVNMIGMFNSLKDGETTVDEMFGRRKKGDDKNSLSDKEFKQLIKDLSNYEISLKSAEEKYKGYDFTDSQKEEIKKAGTITDERLNKIVQIISNDKKPLQYFEFYLTDEQMKIVADGVADLEIQKQQ